MKLVQVDVIGLKAPQAVFYRFPDEFGRSALLAWRYFISKFGGEHDFISLALKDPTEELLALGAAVNIGRIEKVDPAVDRRIYNDGGRRFIDAPAKVIAADADYRDAERSNPSSFHVYRFYGLDRLDGVE